MYLVAILCIVESRLKRSLILGWLHNLGPGHSAAGEER